MRVLALVTDAFGGQGGIAKFNRDLLSALCSHPDVEQVVALPRLIPDSPGLLPNKLKYATDAAGGKLRYVLAVLKSAIVNRKSSIIVCGHINLLPVAFALRLLIRAPIVLVIHGVDAWKPTRSRLVNRLAKSVNHTVAVSEFTSGRFCSWSGVARDKISILPNCVDASRFTPGEKDTRLLERYNLHGRTVLLTVARLSAQERYKGIDEVLEAIPDLLRKYPKLVYLIVGDGSDRARLERKAADLGIGECVVFAGWISGYETVEYYRLADAFIMPGRGEGFGIVYLEAMACGVPVVASKADAGMEVVQGCETAVLANPDDPEEIKSAIYRALEMRRGVVPDRVKSYSKQRFESLCHGMLSTLTNKLSEASRKNILVFRIGQLGDTIVALPAMWAVKKQFPDARFTLLCDRHPGKRHVFGPDLLDGSGLFDAFEFYPVRDSAVGRLWQAKDMLQLLRRLRKQRFDTLVYLAPSNRTPTQVERDRRFFSAAGIKNFIGMRGFVDLPRKIPGKPLAATPAESDLLLSRLAADGLKVPNPGHGLLDLNLGAAEEASVAAWLENLPTDEGRRWLAVGPGSKMPAKRWPEDRFRDVVEKLIQSFGVWPVVFGGPEDRRMGDHLLRAWGCGYNAAGSLSLRTSAAALKRCLMYLGNDTGTMHLAASVGVPCAAIFSAREWPGMWHPYGVPQKVFRSEVECDGCGLVECVERKNECLNRIAVAEVFSTCAEILVGRLVTSARNTVSTVTT